MHKDRNSQIINVIDPVAQAGLSGHPLCRMAAWPVGPPCANAVFTAIEAERLVRMKSPLRQAEMAGSFALRRRLIAEMAGGLAEEVEVMSAADGAPLLLQPTGWAMSLANKDAYTVVALSRATAEIGVDIEIVREMDWRPALSMTCSDAERAEFERAPGDPASKLRAFYRMWTLKEAVLKSTGRGLQAFGGTFDFWTADTGDTIVSLVQKRV
jgi:4'-phosphopantetheinyl transferase